jgi:chromatin assembly factor 1 subunit B
LTLLISSSDGFCSTLSFSPGELGTVYTGDLGPPKPAVPVSSNQNTPVPTPTSVFAPPSPFPNGSHHRHRDSASSLTAPSPPMVTASFVNPRAASPARSNSNASTITQASTSQTGVLSNPPLIAGQVPSIAATNSSKVMGVPITTPPETPRASFASSTGTKRETAEGEADDSSGGQPKRRRIAPTLVSGGSQSSGNNDDAKT